jgi:NitT/TauT family transport system ATP-binding protein
MDEPLQKSPYVIIEQLSSSLPTRDSKSKEHNVIFDGLSFSLNHGEFTTIFGPNGSGKTTLLNLLAGLIKPDSGRILIGKKRPFPGVATYLFQNFKDSLFPWRSVEGNLLFPLECQYLHEEEQHQRLRELIKEFDFKIPLKARVYELSVGQQQMVALARALLSRPKFLLMDEPFSALDFSVRRSMQEKLLTYWKKYSATILLVSHDIDEAIYLGQRVLLFPPHPITTIGEVVVPLPFPRHRDMLYTQDHFHMRSEALQFFDEKTESD